MTKIALVEKDEDLNSSEFDKVISFGKENYINVEEYVAIEELNRVYDEAYSNLYLWLNRQNRTGGFNYLGTDIIQAYGLKCFDFLLNVCQKAYTVRKIIARESPEELWISDGPHRDELVYPFLSMYAPGIIKDDISLKYFTDNRKDQHPQREGKERPGLLMESCPNFIRSLSNLLFQTKDEQILIYSDLTKIPALLDYLKDRKVIFLRDELPLRLIPYLLARRTQIRLFEDFKVSKAEQDEIARLSAIFIDRLINSSEPLMVGGTDFAPYLKRYLAANWKKNLTSALKMVKQSHLLFKRFRIRSLLVDEDRAITKNLVVQVSRHYQCKSYVNCHGDPGHKIGTLPLTADYVLVWGQMQKRLFTRWGLDEDRVMVVGSTIHDKYLHRSTVLTKKRICSDLNLSAGKPLVLIASCPLVERRNILEKVMWQEIKTVITAVCGVEDIQVVIKLHPGDDNEPYVHQLVKGLNTDKTRVIRDYDPLALAYGADILVIYGSTFSIDGLAYKKPVILADQCSTERYRELIEVFYDGTTFAKLLDSIHGILNRSYKNHITSWSPAVDYCLNGMTGMASEKVADILEKL